MSLNEREQIKERQANQIRQKARDKERDARKPSGMNIYAITVESADKPGLPEPVGSTASNPAALTDGKTNVVKQAEEATTVSANVDPMEDETENILEDYISALSANRTLIAK